MTNVVLIKDNVVVTLVFSVDADTAVLSNAANVGDLYDPETGEFTAPPAPEPPAPFVPPTPPEE